MKSIPSELSYFVWFDENGLHSEKVISWELLPDSSVFPTLETSGMVYPYRLSPFCYWYPQKQSRLDLLDALKTVVIEFEKQPNIPASLQSSNIEKEFDDLFVGVEKTRMMNRADDKATIKSYEKAIQKANKMDLADEKKERNGAKKA